MLEQALQTFYRRQLDLIAQTANRQSLPTCTKTTIT